MPLSDRLQVHQRARVDQSRRAKTPRSASPVTRRSRWATLFSSTCPSRAPKSRPAKPLARVESVKAVSDLYAPVSGTVTEVNGELATAPEKINKDAACSAWMIKITLKDPGELNALLSAADYEKFVAEEGGH